MRNPINFTIIFIFYSLLMPAQEVVVSSIDNTNGLLIHSNNLYYSVFSGGIFKIDLNNINASPTTITTGLQRPYGMAIIGTELYFVENNDNSISKIDLAQATTNPTLVVSGLTNPKGILKYGNELFIAQSGADKISKIDISQSNPTVIDVITGIDDPNSMIISGNHLYISAGDAGGVYKADLNNLNNITAINQGGLNYPSGIAIHGNYLYVCEASSDGISRLDITSVPSTPTRVYGMFVNSEMAVKDNYLYVGRTGFGAGRGSLLRYDLSTLSLESHSDHGILNIHPNPSSDIIYISDLNTPYSYTIINHLGQSVKQGSANTSSIRIDELSTGVYCLKITDKGVARFIKE